MTGNEWSDNPLMQIRDRIRELRRVKARDLAPHPQNWRTHPKEQQDALKGVLAEIGYADALIAREQADGSLQLIDGHLRAETTPDTEVPVLVTDLSPDEAAKLLATLDPLAAMAETDAAKLDELLKGVATDSEALQGMLDGLKEDAGLGGNAPGDGGDEFDATPDASGPTRTAVGDVWVIGGKHRLLVGDCTDAEKVARLMAGETIGLCFTSPPYAQQRDYGEAAKEKVQDWYTLMCGAFAHLPMKQNGQVLVNLGLIHREGEWMPYWHEWIEWMRQQGWRRFGWYVWDQGSGLPGDWNGRFAPCHEFIWHFNRESIRPEKTVEKNPNSGPMGTNIRDKSGKNKAASSICPDPNKIPDSVVRVNRNSSHGTGHPATFPIPLPTAFLEAWPADVYDPFLGSGTTLIAAHRLGRVCYGCEIEPRYGDVILKRAEAEGLTCEKADG